MEAVSREQAIAGCLLGTAVGDALGLPYEGLSSRRGRKLFGPPNRYHLLFGRGMVSDDTEHACMTAQAMLGSEGNVNRFTEDLARRLRWWLLGVPAGIGLATLKSIAKLWVGFPPARSGVWSAGNGPAMRAAIIGAAATGLEQTLSFTVASTQMTHRDPKAVHGAVAVALAAYLGSRDPAVGGRAYLDQLTELLSDLNAAEFLELIRLACSSANSGHTTTEFALACGFTKGVSGYIYHTVPVAIHAWLAHRSNYFEAVSEIIECGGDTDTTGAIAGGLIGATLGERAIDPHLLSGILGWPHTVSWMRQLAASLAAPLNNPVSPPRLGIASLGVLPRNAMFATVVIAHALRRLLPPY